MIKIVKAVFMKMVKIVKWKIWSATSFTDFFFIKSIKRQSKMLLWILNHILTWFQFRSTYLFWARLLISTHRGYIAWLIASYLDPGTLKCALQIFTDHNSFSFYTLSVSKISNIFLFIIVYVFNSHKIFLFFCVG